MTFGRWVLFLAGLGIGAAIGAWQTMGRVETFFGADEFQRFKRSYSEPFKK